jgi:putative ABC transport system permease protein
VLKHYVAQALRSFWRFRITAGVNLLGLVLAVVCFVATYVYLDSLLRSDAQFPKAERTWVITQEIWNGPSSKMVPAFPQAGAPTAKYLRLDFPGLDAVARAVNLGPQSAASEDRKASLFVAAVDPEFFRIFDFDFKQGDAATAASSAHSAIVTERTAERLFGTKQALGRRILLQNRIEVTVTGVIPVPPQPSHMGDQVGPGSLMFEMLIPMSLLKEQQSGFVVDPDNTEWANDSFFTYVLFPADGSLTPQELIRQLPAFAERRAQEPLFRSVFGLVPLTHVQLANMDALIGDNALPLATMIFALDALILAIAVVNYANLAVAIATTRAKEIGVRKVVGATSLHLMRQYLVEAGLLGATAVVIVIALAFLVIEPINRALQTNLTIAAMLKPDLWLMVVGLIAAISLMGGLYPALVLSRVRPVEALRAGSVRAGPRFVPTILVGAQFAAASFLLVVALVMAQQNHMMKKRGLQTDRDPVVLIGNILAQIGMSFDSLREELLRSPDIKEVTTINDVPWQSGGWHMTLARGVTVGAPRVDTIFNMVGPHFFEVMGINLLAGRLPDRDHRDGFSPRPPLPPEIPIVIDRDLATGLGWRNPNDAVNKVTYSNSFGPKPMPCRIMGVVENGFPRLVGPNTASNIYALQSEPAGMPLVRVSRQNVPAAVKYIDSTWDSLAPKVQIRREFMDTMFNLAYQTYATTNAVLNGLAAFAFFIAVMGLCGLAIHVTSRRQREIGIRKTLGATVHGVVMMLLIDFAKPVLIANLIAWPFAWWVGHQYMDKFTQRSEMTIWPFVASLVVTVAVAWASVAVQALRAATVKPANVLYAQ